MKKETKRKPSRTTTAQFHKQLIACRDSRAPERPQCAMSQMVMGSFEPKVQIDDLGCKAFASEDVFFGKFVFRVCDKKNARPNRKRYAAREIPGLAEYKGSRGVRWRLSYRQLARDLPLDKLRIFLGLIDPDSSFYRRVMGGDERKRFLSDKLH